MKEERNQPDGDQVTDCCCYVCCILFAELEIYYYYYYYYPPNFLVIKSLGLDTGVVLHIVIYIQFNIP